MQDYSGDDTNLDDSFTDPPYDPKDNREGEESDDDFEEEKGEPEAHGSKPLCHTDNRPQPSNQSEYRESEMSRTIEASHERKKTSKSPVIGNGKPGEKRGTARSNLYARRESDKDKFGTDVSVQDFDIVEERQIMSDSTLDGEELNLFRQGYKNKPDGDDGRERNDNESDVESTEDERERNDNESDVESTEKESNASRNTKSSSKDGVQPEENVTKEQQLMEKMLNHNKKMMAMVRPNNQEEALELMKDFRTTFHSYAKQSREELKEAQARKNKKGTF